MREGGRVEGQKEREGEPGGGTHNMAGKQATITDGARFGPQDQEVMCLRAGENEHASFLRALDRASGMETRETCV